MNKTYFSPKTRVVKVEVARMIAASENLTINRNGEALTGESSVASRGNDSFWDDEEY